MAFSNVTLNTTPTMTLVSLNNAPSSTLVALNTTPSFNLLGSWKTIDSNWEDETKNYEQIGLLGKDSD
jgi:hypothetical protein|tara:strand:- start:2065 stop:2268 length:204 start_codon:yes stop_codon:yes gene_type:complete